MATYQFCSLDSGGIHVTNHSRACADDIDARAAAQRFIPGGGTSEIWAGERLVGTIWMPFLEAAAPNPPEAAP